MGHSRQANSEITLPFLLGIILSVTVLVLILSKLGAVSDLFSGTAGGSNFNDVADHIESFSDARGRGEFITRRYLLRLEEDDAIFGINSEAEYAEFRVILSRGTIERRTTQEETVHRFFRPSSCPQREACLCFCNTVTYPTQGQISEISCERMVCQELNNTQFGDNAYLKKFASDRFLEVQSSEGIYLSLIDFGIEGTNVGYTPEGVRLTETPTENSFVLQWVQQDQAILVCDYFNNWLGGVCTEFS